MSKKMSKMNIAAIVLAMSFVAHQTFSLNAFATDITGITGNNGVFNINPQHVRDGMGLREYKNFTLSEGDIANLIFKYGAENVSKFVNLVDNQININGLVNTVRDGQFYNGEAIFVSPNGMVVGGSGVLNVGSLSVLTPTASGMRMFKKGTASLEELGYHGNADVTIDGNVLSRGNVGIVARDINLGGLSKIVAGGDSATQGKLVNSKEEATALFNALVNTGATNNTSNIEFRTYNRDGGGVNGMKIGGNIRNLGEGDIILTNRGKAFTTTGSISAENGTIRLINGNGDMNISGVNHNIEAKNGKVYVSAGSQSGSLDIASNLNISASDLVEIVHNGSGNSTIAGNIKSKKDINITEKKGDLIINGKIGYASTKGRVVLASNGTGMTINEGAVLTNSGTTRIANTGAKGLTINGNINNTGSLAITSRNGNFNVGETSTITNNNGKLNLTNTSGKFTMAGTVKASGEEALIQNTGANGFDMTGTIVSQADTYVQNTKGDLNLSGKVQSSKLAYVGNTGNGGLNISGETASVTTQGGRVAVVNMGEKGLTVDSDATIAATGAGRVAVTNRKGKMLAAGKFQTENGDMHLSNAGAGGLEIAHGALVKSTGAGQLVVQNTNTGTAGMLIDGTVQNNGQTLIYNKAGNLDITGTVTNTGANMSITNAGGALNVESGAKVSNDNHRLYITNKGAGGMDIQGHVTSKGHVLLTNRAGGMDVAGNVQSTLANVVLSNSGAGEMNVSGKVQGQKITATGKGSDIVLGDVLNEEAVLDAEKKVVINVENGDLLNAGTEGDLIKSKGKLFIDVKNGSIGEDVIATDNSIGQDSRDLTKSINVNVAGGVKAFVTGASKDDVINIASENADLNVDRIKNANGKVMLLTGTDKNILNASTNLKEYANVNGGTVQIISGGTVGTADKALHFRQTDATQQSNVLARKDINLYQRGEEQGENVNFGVIKSKEGSIKANMIKEGVVENAIAPGNIEITSRKSTMLENQVNVKNKTHNTNEIQDYFDK